MSPPMAKLTCGVVVVRAARGARGARAIVFADRPISARGGMGTKQRRTALQCFRAGAASINRPYWASLGYIVIQASSMLHIWPWRSRAILGRCDLRVWPRGGPHPSVQRFTTPGRHGPRRAGLSRGNLCQFWRPSGRAQKVPKQGAKGRLPIWPASWPAERRSHPPSAASNRRQTAPSSTVGGPSVARGSYIPQTL